MLVQRILRGSRRSVIECRVLGRGGLLDARRVIAHIDQFRQQSRNLQKVVACIDCEDYTVGEVLNEVSRVVAEIRRQEPPLIPDYIIVMHALEAWTGGDEEALRTYLKTPPGKHLRLPTENDPRPKQTLRRLFQQYRRDFLETRDNPRLAQIVALDVLRRYNSSFAEFEQKVLDP